MHNNDCVLTASAVCTAHYTYMYTMYTARARSPHTVIFSRHAAAYIHTRYDSFIFIEKNKNKSDTWCNRIDFCTAAAAVYSFFLSARFRSSRNYTRSRRQYMQAGKLCIPHWCTEHAPTLRLTTMSSWSWSTLTDLNCGLIYNILRICLFYRMQKKTNGLREEEENEELSSKNQII